MAVVIEAMRTYFFQRAAAVYFAVAGQIEMIAPRPKAPAMAVATVMITLRTMPHTDFDFLSSLMMIGN